VDADKRSDLISAISAALGSMFSSVAWEGVTLLLGRLKIQNAMD
jgi:hypothetical protein